MKAYLSVGLLLWWSVAVSCTETGYVGRLCPPAKCSNPAGSSSPPPHADAGDGEDAGALDEALTAICATIFAACVTRDAPDVDACLRDFSTCGGVLNAADHGPGATCAVQLSACVLHDPGMLEVCLADYRSCGR